VVNCIEHVVKLVTNERLLAAPLEDDTNALVQHGLVVRVVCVELELVAHLLAELDVPLIVVDLLNSLDQELEHQVFPL